MRSGDVFAVHDNTHYAPPPVSYYADIIDAHAFQRIKILCEDGANPVVAELLERYGGRAHWHASSVELDVGHLVRARRVIYGAGTFAPALLMFNKNRLLQYFRVNYAAEDPLLDSRSTAQPVVVDMIPYFRAVFPWRATRKQRDLLATWPPCDAKEAATATCEQRPGAASTVRCVRRGSDAPACWRRAS